jgi:hypothetical protein
MKLEAEKLRRTDFHQLGWADRLRKAKVFAPPVMFFYCLFVKGVILNGRIGLYYALQRTFSEFLLSLYLIENSLNAKQRRRNSEKTQDETELNVRVNTAYGNEQAVSITEPPSLSRRY